MNINRRDVIVRSLFGAGLLGLRALATGLPVSFLASPRRALAAGGDMGCANASKAQYIIFSTSAGGDPINAGAPGTYENSNIVHSSDPSMAATGVTFGSTNTTAARPWSTLPDNVRARTTFWHLMTDTPIHPREREVLRLMGATAQAAGNEMLPSLLANALAPCLNTIQPQPLSLVSNPSEAIYYQGAPMPSIPPLALKDTLTNPTGPLSQLQSLRDSTMNSIYDLYKGVATPPQQAYIDQMVVSQQQVRKLNQSLLSTLGSIKDNFIGAQLLAAVTLIQLNIAPVIAVHIPFGGDNHSDKGLAVETAETVGTAAMPTGVAGIAYLMQLLGAATDAQGNSLKDRVSLVSLNVFGRTLMTNSGAGGAQDGRGHNPNHLVSFTIGSPFKGGVIGGCGPVGIDIGCTSINSSTGASGGDIQAIDTLAAYAQTLLASVGGDPTIITSPTGTAKVINAALA